MKDPNIEPVVARLAIALAKIPFSLDDTDLKEVATAFTEKISGKNVREVAAEYISPDDQDTSQQACGGNGCPFFKWQQMESGSGGMCMLASKYVVVPGNPYQNEVHYRYEGRDYIANKRTDECLAILPPQKK